MPKEYKLCISTENPDERFSVFIFQDENLNLIHSDTELLIRNESQFVLYPGSSIIVDLFECQGESKFFYSSDLELVKEKEREAVQGINGQKHAIKI